MDPCCTRLRPPLAKGVCPGPMRPVAMMEWKGVSGVVESRLRRRFGSRREVVLSASFYSRNDNIAPYLKPGPMGRVGDFPADVFVQDVRHVIESELPRELDELFGLTIETKVIAVREGSILIYFGAAIAGLATFSRYKGLCESVNLLKGQLGRLLHLLIEQKYPDDIQVNVNVEFPHLDSPGDWPWRWRKFMRDPEDEYMASMLVGGVDRPVRAKRDGFFWFLLVLCILETAALAALVWRAVTTTYFPQGVALATHDATVEVAPARPETTPP